MAGPYYIMPNGKFPTQGGVPVLVTQAQFDACCCNPCNDCHPPLRRTYRITVSNPTCVWKGGTWTVTLSGLCTWSFRLSPSAAITLTVGKVSGSNYMWQVSASDPNGSLLWWFKEGLQQCVVPASLPFYSGYPWPVTISP